MYLILDAKKVVAFLEKHPPMGMDTELEENSMFCESQEVVMYILFLYLLGLCHPLLVLPVATFMLIQSFEKRYFKSS